MPFEKGNKFGGNKQGGRLGYTYEKDQLVKLRRIVDRALAKLEAFEQGKISDKEVEKLKFSMPIVLKAMDKLHANKQQLNLGLGDGDEGQNNLSELTVFFRAIAQPQQLNDGSGPTSLPDSSQVIQE